MKNLLIKIALLISVMIITNNIFSIITSSIFCMTVQSFIFEIFFSNFFEKKQ